MKVLMTVGLLTVLISVQSQSDNYLKTINWLKENNIEVNNPSPPKGYQKFFDCDSNVVYKKVSGDTIKFYTLSSSEYITLQQLSKLQKRPYFNIIVYPKKIHETGVISIVRLEPKTFLISNDSLYLVSNLDNDVYRMTSNMEDRIHNMSNTLNATQDMLVKMEKDIKNNSDSALIDLFVMTNNIMDEQDLQNFDETERIRSGTHPSNFVLIFYKSMFDDSNSVTIRGIQKSSHLNNKYNSEGERVKLVRKWEENGKTCYDIKVYKENTYTINDLAFPSIDFLFTSDWTFLEWENCQANKKTIQSFTDSISQKNADSIFNNSRNKRQLTSKKSGSKIDCSDLVGVGVYKKYGVIDKEGNEVIPIKYDIVRYEGGGLFSVILNNKYGFIDEYGKKIIPPQYDGAESFSNGLAAVKLIDHWGYINKAGEKVIAFKYDEARRFYKGLAVVKFNNQYGLINKKGDEVIPFKYEYVSEFENGLAIVKLNNKSSMIDSSGKELYPFIYDGIDFFKDGLALVNLKGKYGFIDKRGREVIPVKYDNYMFFHEEFANVTREGMHGIIDKTGREVVPIKFDEVEVLNDTLISVSLNGKYGILDNTGKEIFPMKFDDKIEVFDDGLFIVTLNNKKSVTDKTGKEAVPFRYSIIHKLDKGLAVVEKDVDNSDVIKSADWDEETKKGLIDKNGKEIIQPIYDYVGIYSSEGLIMVELDGKYGYFDMEGKEVIPVRYQGTKSFYKGLIAVQLNNKWGYIDKKGNEVVPFKYDKVEDFYSEVNPFFDELAAVSVNKKWGFINAQGKEVIPVKYDEHGNFFKGLGSVAIGNKWGIIDKNGKEVIPFLYDFATPFTGCN